MVRTEGQELAEEREASGRGILNRRGPEGAETSVGSRKGERAKTRKIEIRSGTGQWSHGLLLHAEAPRRGGRRSSSRLGRQEYEEEEEEAEDTTERRVAEGAEVRRRLAEQTGGLLRTWFGRRDRSWQSKGRWFGRQVGRIAKTRNGENANDRNTIRCGQWSVVSRAVVSRGGAEARGETFFEQTRSAGWKRNMGERKIF